MGKPETVIRELEIDKVTKMGMNVYDTKVDNIPDGLIEYLLWLDGRVMIWNNPLMGWIATRCSEVGQDYNGIPNRFKPVFTSAFADMNTPELTEEDDCVIIWDSLDYNQKRSDVLYKCRDYADTHMTNIFLILSLSLGLATIPIIGVFWLNTCWRIVIWVSA